MELRVRGMTFADIGKSLGISTQVAHRHYQRAMAEAKVATEDRVAEARILADRRFDAVIQKHWLQMGQARSADVIIRAELARARILGHAAPERSELTGKDGGPVQTESTGPVLTDEERLARLEELRSIALARVEAKRRREAEAAEAAGLSEGGGAGGDVPGAE